ncbi:hypothetical protein [Streptomyces virginiae]
MNVSTVPEGPHTGVDGLCEHIRGPLAAWVPRILGVHVHRSLAGPVEVAHLVGTVADAAEVTILPGGDDGDGDIAREELHAAARRASAAVAEPSGTAVLAELAAVRAGCRRAAVALGLPVPVTL